MKVIKYLAPLLCALQLAGCGDDDLAESSSTPPTEYTFKSRTNIDIPSSVSNGNAITQELLLGELITYLKGVGVLDVALSYYSDGTNPLEESASLGFDGLIRRNSNSSLELVENNFNNSLVYTNLQNSVTTAGLNLPFYEQPNNLLIYTFVGWPLLEGVTSGRDQTDALILSWLEQVSLLRGGATGRYLGIKSDGAHLLELLKSLLAGSVKYSTIAQNNLVSSKGLLADNSKAINWEVVAEQEALVADKEALLISYQKTLKAREAQLAYLLKTWKEYAGDDADPQQPRSFYLETNPYYTLIQSYYDELGTVASVLSKIETIEIAIEDAKALVEPLMPSTLLAKNWDEAFGHFGAARNYGTRANSDVSSQPDFDENMDEKLDAFTEINFGYALWAAQRDEGAALGNTDYSGNIWNAFLLGRQIIQDNYGRNATESVGYHRGLKAQSDIIISNLEKVIAATLVHHINNAILNLDSVDLSELDNAYFKEWSILKGIALTLQFNHSPIITKDELTWIHDILKTAPLSDSLYISSHQFDLGRVKDKLQAIYSFDAANVQAW